MSERCFTKCHETISTSSTSPSQHHHHPSFITLPVKLMYASEVSPMSPTLYGTDSIEVAITTIETLDRAVRA